MPLYCRFKAGSIYCKYPCRSTLDEGYPEKVLSAHRLDLFCSIYMWPSYTRVRSIFPERSIWWTIKVCWWEKKLPTLQQAHDIRRQMTTASRQLTTPSQMQDAVSSSLSESRFSSTLESMSVVPTTVSSNKRASRHSTPPMMTSVVEQEGMKCEDDESTTRGQQDEDVALSAMHATDDDAVPAR